MVAGGLFNAVAFAGAGYLFQKFNKDGYGEETKRHDLALEKLEKARQEWNQKDIEVKKRWRLYVENIAMRTQILKILTRH